MTFRWATVAQFARNCWFNNKTFYSASVAHLANNAVDLQLDAFLGLSRTNHCFECHIDKSPKETKHVLGNIQIVYVPTSQVRPLWGIFVLFSNFRVNYLSTHALIRRNVQFTYA